VPGSVVALEGPLGAGKTTLVKGIALALGIVEPVTSPTFTLISEYEGTMPLYHMDLYRIGSMEEFELLGVEEMLYGDGVCCIEWAEKALPLFPKDHVSVRLGISPDGGRTLSLEGITL
jgi:tRNA threonylcarbamoyladenosine biosynthesis protein TsaE